MILIFAHHYDEEVKWVFNNLPLQHKKITVKLIIAEALGIDYDISFYMENNINTTAISFKDVARTVRGKDVSMVINRLTFIDPLVWNKSDEKEKVYAMNEINAFFAAFIHSFSCPLINEIEYGSLFVNNVTVLKVIKFLQQNEFRIHPYVMEENENLSKMMEENGPSCLRMLCWNNKIFFPQYQSNIAFNEMVISAFQTQKLSCALELFFVSKNEKFELIYISKSPALSLYGQPLLQNIFHLVNAQELCY